MNVRLPPHDDGLSTPAIKTKRGYYVPASNYRWLPLRLCIFHSNTPPPPKHRPASTVRLVRRSLHVSNCVLTAPHPTGLYPPTLHGAALDDCHKFIVLRSMRW